MNADTGPLLDFGGRTPYLDYQSIDTLLSLQHPRSTEPAELSFYVVGQVKELLFKLLYEESCRARALLDQDEPGRATRVLHRVRKVVDLLVSCWDVLSTLTPQEFNAFREHLGQASGVQSYMYRMVEYVLGNKNPALARPHDQPAEVAEAVRSALRSPSLYDAAVALLARRGAPVPTDILTRDPAVPHAPSPAVEQAWRAVYADAPPEAELPRLGEALMDLAEGMSRWRALHLLTVERIIGTKPGTGGTCGASWLRRVNEHRFFPELWAARTLL
ncbi:tryptophan 2,3-dioxygenase [Saccharothrix australiensis]|uniref:Tryptophan 2,3-dioxygenase n=1 Tax=Saccharothrix australiensis TaxID=2072 RepID=A0A495W469_9PSEU|nr:tryptophan 2,3-dioxygenase family protein [Saccharothrix australiensis]RKT55565.1 tryptophan 2,3-dioxygenase [Saccharothrix australiensis]